MIRAMVRYLGLSLYPAARLWARKGYFDAQVPTPPPNKIALIACHWIGDTFWAGQVVPFLREKYPRAEFFALTKPFSVDLWNDLIDRDHVLVTPEVTSDRKRERASWRNIARRAKTLRNHRFDWVIDLTGNRYSAAFTCLLRPRWSIGADGNELGFLYSRKACGTWPRDRHFSERPFEIVKPLLGRFAYPSALRPSIPARTFEDVCRDLGLDPGHPLAVLAPGAGWPEKEWAPENFAQLARRLADRGSQVVVLGSSAQASLCRRVLGMDPAGTIRPGSALMIGRPMGEVLGLLSGATVVVGNESGIPHLAAAMGRRTIAIFTKNGTPLWGTPKGPRVIAFDIVRDPTVSPAKVADAAMTGNLAASSDNDKTTCVKRES